MLTGYLDPMDLIGAFKYIHRSIFLSIYVYNLGLFLSIYIYIYIGAGSMDMDKVQIHTTGFLDPMDLSGEF